MSTPKDRVVIAVAGLWLIGMAVSVGITVGVVAAVLHFILKLW